MMSREGVMIAMCFCGDHKQLLEFRVMIHNRILYQQTVGVCCQVVMTCRSVKVAKCCDEFARQVWSTYE